MANLDKILVTGGSGLLGGELRRLVPEMCYPSRTEFDMTDYEGMKQYLDDRDFDSVLHAAAFTSPPRIDENPMLALEANIIGTSNVVKLCSQFDMKIVYISTDYVFRGARGYYEEEDALHPVNKYAWSKLGGECAVRLYDNSLIIRTSFGPNEFPYPKAFIDQWTSRQPVCFIAEKIVKLLQTEITGIIHIGGERRTVYEYALSQNPEKGVGELSLNDISFSVPKDTSLNCEKYYSLIDENLKTGGKLQ